MFKTALCIFTGTLILSCGHKSGHSALKTNGFKSDSISIEATIPNNPAVGGINSIDSILNDYFRYSDNDLVSLARKDNLVEEALFDKKEKKDSINFYVFQIGHNVTDGDGKRFITDSWIYIDSVTQKIYEYDIANDSLAKWEK
jgi:hypothetical protein